MQDPKSQVRELSDAELDAVAAGAHSPPANGRSVGAGTSASRPDSVSGAERIVRVARTIISDSGAKPQLEHAERTR